MLISLIGIVWLTQALRFIPYIADRGLPMSLFFKITLTLLPNPIAIIAPFCVFATIMFVYNKLFFDRELVVMRSFGLSTWELSRPAMVLTLVVSILTAAINWGGGAYFAKLTRQLQWDFRHDLTSLYIQEGNFNHVSNDVTFYVKEVSNERIKGVFINDRRRAGSDLTIMAKEGRLLSGPDGLTVILNDGSLQDINLKTRASTFGYFDSYNMNLGLLERDARTRSPSLAELHLTDIFAADKPHRLRPGYRTEGHMRILNPLMVPVFAVFAILAVLGGGFDRRGMGFRLFQYTIGTALLYALRVWLAGFVARNEHLMFLLYVYHFVLLFASLYLLFRCDRAPKTVAV
jgi:lipopolysaccharide export system permease protein